MSFVLLVSPAAREDLLAIYRYSRGRWGQAKADAYLERIDAEAIQILRILHGRQDPGHNLI